MQKIKHSFVLVIILSLFLLAGCAGFSTNAQPVGVRHGVLTGDVTYPCFINSHTEIKLDSDDFEIMRTVTAETSSVSVLGIFGHGDNGYGALFAKAQAIGADDVINIKVDTRTQSFLMCFWKRATTKLTGTAIRWKK